MTRSQARDYARGMFVESAAQRHLGWGQRMIPHAMTEM